MKLFKRGADKKHRTETHRQQSNLFQVNGRKLCSKMDMSDIPS